MKMISTVFDRTAEEMGGLVAQGRGREGIEEQGVVSYLEIRTTAKYGKQLQARLTKLLKSIEEAPDATKKSDEKRYRLTLAFYPLDSDA